MFCFPLFLDIFMLFYVFVANEMDKSFQGKKEAFISSRGNFHLTLVAIDFNDHTFVLQQLVVRWLKGESFYVM